MDAQQQDCCLCGRRIGKGQKYDLNIRENAYYVGNFQLLLQLQETTDSTKVCARCYNRNREFNKRKTLPPSANTTQVPAKKKDDNEIRDRYFVDTITIEELTSTLVGACKCGGRWADCRQRGHGPVLHIDIYCEHGHSFIWSSLRVPPPK